MVVKFPKPLFSASANNGANAGPAYVNANNTASNANANIGFQLSFLFFGILDLAPWQKNTLSNEYFGKAIEEVFN